MHENPDYHEDYSNYNEFGPEPASIPDELKICGNCAFYDAKMAPVTVFTAYGDEIEARNCECDDLGYRNYVLTEYETNACPCRYFTPTAETRAAAEDYAAEEINRHKYNGIGPHDFY